MKQEIRKLLGTDKIVIGTDRTIKYLRENKLKKVILSENCQNDVFNQIKLLVNLQDDVVIEKSELKNEELGVLCKKPFRVSVIGFM